MTKKYMITFHEAHGPIVDPVTKFGGQPVWVADPVWPLSRSTGQPMQFIGQIALDRDLFGDVPARMAYLFMTDTDGSAETWDPNAGENAVVLQPSIYPGAALPHSRPVPLSTEWSWIRQGAEGSPCPASTL
jgi:hypothetical protein